MILGFESNRCQLWGEWESEAWYDTSHWGGLDVWKTMRWRGLEYKVGIWEWHRGAECESWAPVTWVKLLYFILNHSFQTDTNTDKLQCPAYCKKYTVCPQNWWQLFRTVKQVTLCMAQISLWTFINSVIQKGGYKICCG